MALSDSEALIIFRAAVTILQTFYNKPVFFADTREAQAAILKDWSSVSTVKARGASRETMDLKIRSIHFFAFAT